MGDWDAPAADWGDGASSDNKASAESKKESNGSDDWGAAPSDWGTTADWNSSSNENGSGSSSNFGGKPRGKGCFKCGEEGHMSRDCPKGGGGGNRGKGCFKCGEEGHMSRDCPKGGGKGCFKCGKEGHISRDCTESGGGSKRSFGGSKECFKCGKEGHFSRECPNEGSSKKFKSSNGSDNNGGSTDWGSSANESTDWGASGSSSDNKGETADWGTSAGNSSAKNEANTSDWGATTTTDWGASGDSASDGAKNSRGSSKGCFKCGEEGHMSRECPKGGGGGNRGKGCFKCGEEGHMSRDCTKEGENGDSRVREKYTPPTLDETDESIVMSTIAPGSNFHKSMLAGKCKVTPEEWGDKHFMSFEEALKSETLLTALQKGSITEPTPIQKYAMKVIMEGHDMMACSYTGSGKTLAYVLPILQYLFDERELPNGYGQECQEPVALTICPTRELAKQVYEVFFKFTRGTILKPQILYGGTSVTHQKGQLSAGCHILVGTPGRIRHFLKDGLIALSKLKYLVLDEADRMIDDGFIPDVRQMMVHPTTTKKEDRQTLMFSATYPAKVQQVAGEFLRKGYYFVSTGTGDKIGGANEDIDQQILLVEKSQKRPKLVEILGTTDIKDRTMVFVDAKKTADFLASYLSQSGYKSTSMHGDRYQRQREQALNDLKSGKFPILVATNVAARGLDVSDIRHVINYDLPSEIDEYVHRIGRTGRVGNIGKATSFYDPNSNDKRLAADLLDVLKDANKTIPDWLKEEAEGGQSKFGSDDYGKTDIRTATDYADLDKPPDADASSAMDGW